jgi:hypothetical protein
VLVKSGIVENLKLQFGFILLQRPRQCTFGNSKLSYYAPRQVDTSDMPFSKQRTTGGDGSSGDHNYELYSRVRKIVLHCTVSSKSMRVKMKERSRLNFSKCQDLTASWSISQIFRDNGNTPLAVPLDWNKTARHVL